jgi:hypothetical protein
LGSRAKNLGIMRLLTLEALLEEDDAIAFCREGLTLTESSDDPATLVFPQDRKRLALESRRLHEKKLT